MFKKIQKPGLKSVKNLLKTEKKNEQNSLTRCLNTKKGVTLRIIYGKTKICLKKYK